MGIQHWIQLSLTEGIGPILSRRLVESAGGAEAACAATTKTLQQVEGIGTAKSGSILESLRRAADDVQAEIDRAAAAGVKVVCPDDEIYPLLLKEIPDPPLVLYVKGDLQPRDLMAVSIVGSRRCSYYGREQSERFAALLAGAGLTVISGGARGVDSAAHRGAMSHPQGRTIAVLGSGVDVAYPPENTSLFEQIARRGAVISEYAMGTPPLAENFPKRNRIISGMSRGVLVIEADERSGALITARQAADDHNRPVFALPGRVDNKMSAGPHKLIRDGAILTRSLDDILESLGPLPQSAIEPQFFSDESTKSEDEKPKSAAGGIQLTDQQNLVLATLGEDPLIVDDIIERTRLSASNVMQALTFLTLKGLIQRVDGQSFARKR